MGWLGLGLGLVEITEISNHIEYLKENVGEKSFAYDSQGEIIMILIDAIYRCLFSTKRSKILIAFASINALKYKIR